MNSSPIIASLSKSLGGYSKLYPELPQVVCCLNHNFACGGEVCNTLEAEEIHYICLYIYMYIIAVKVRTYTYYWYMYMIVCTVRNIRASFGYDFPQLPWHRRARFCR